MNGPTSGNVHPTGDAGCLLCADAGTQPGTTQAKPLPSGSSLSHGDKKRSVSWWSVVRMSVNAGRGCKPTGPGFTETWQPVRLGGEAVSTHTPQVGPQQAEDRRTPPRCHRPH